MTLEAISAEPLLNQNVLCAFCKLK